MMDNENVQPVFLIFVGACVALMIALALTGCEARRVVVEKPDGTRVTYNRNTLFSESNSDGLSLVRDGEDVALEVGPTGSKTDLEALMEAIKIGTQLAVPAPTP